MSRISNAFTVPWDCKPVVIFCCLLWHYFTDRILLRFFTLLFLYICGASRQSGSKMMVMLQLLTKWLLKMVIFCICIALEKTKRRMQIKHERQSFWCMVYWKQQVHGLHSDPNIRWVWENTREWLGYKNKMESFFSSCFLRQIEKEWQRSSEKNCPFYFYFFLILPQFFSFFYTWHLVTRVFSH